MVLTQEEKDCRREAQKRYCERKSKFPNAVARRRDTWKRLSVTIAAPRGK